MTEVTIPIQLNRSRLYATPGRNARAAWQWTYEAIVDGHRHDLGRGLSDACDWCKWQARKRGGTARITKSWSSNPSSED